MDVKLTIRLPEELHRRLVEIASDEERSLNQQVVYFLRRMVERHSGRDD